MTSPSRPLLARSDVSISWPFSLQALGRTSIESAGALCDLRRPFAEASCGAHSISKEWTLCGPCFRKGKSQFMTCSFVTCDRWNCGQWFAATYTYYTYYTASFERQGDEPRGRGRRKFKREAACDRNKTPDTSTDSFRREFVALQMHPTFSDENSVGRAKRMELHRMCVIWSYCFSLFISMYTHDLVCNSMILSCIVVRY